MMKGSIDPRKSQSEPAISSTREASLKDSYLHWYRSHANIGEANRILTEEPDPEYIVDGTSLKTKLCCAKCRNPYLKCFNDLKKIRAYRMNLQDKLEETMSKIRWVDLPGGHHLVALDKNYLMHYIWLVTFITNDVDATSKDDARQIRYRYEDMIFQAENLGIMLQEFFEPLTRIAESHSCVEDIGQIIKSEKRFDWLAAERKIVRLAIKPDATMLTGNRIKDFSKLFIYIRKDCQTWTRFQSLTEPDKVEVVTKGLLEISDNIKDLKTRLKKPLRALKAAKSECPLFNHGLIRNVKHMRECSRKIMKMKAKNLLPKEEDSDWKMLEAMLEETSRHYVYILKYGELLVEELCDIILMARLCYHYVRESTQNNIMVAAYNSVMTHKFRKTRLKKLLKASNFSSDDFYRVNCPDTLRKLPIIVTTINTEICLHVLGHRNSRKSRLSVIPMHKFSIKRFASASSEGEEEPEPDTRKTLQFVSPD